MAVRNGSDILLKLASTVVTGSTNSDYKRVYSMLEATTKDSNGAKEYIVGEGDGDITIAGKNDEAGSNGIWQLQQAAELKQLIAFVWGATSGGSKVITGNCVISDVSITAPQNAVSTWTCTMKISGVITLTSI
jgi:hypothetical protein